MGKTSLWCIPRDHFQTLVDHRSGRISPGDVLLQFVVPAAGGVVGGLLGSVLKDVSAAVSAVAIIAGLLCSMAVFVFQLRLGLLDDRRLGDDDRELVDQCFSNVMWAILVGFGLAVYLVICGAGGWIGCGILGRILTAVAIAVGLHFLLVIAMCLKRLRRAYERIAMKKR